MAEAPDTHITDDMVARGARSLTGNLEWGDVSANVRQMLLGDARAVLSAALAEYTLIRLPEPDEILTEPTSARWNSDGRLVAEGYVVAAIGGPSGPKVNVRGGPYMDADLAEQYAAMLLAAARQARRLAGSQVGDQ